MLEDDVIVDISQSYGKIKDKIEHIEQELDTISKQVDKLTETVKTIIKCVVK